MPAPTIGALPTPPSRNNAPDVFASNADAFLGAFPNLRTDINALVAYLNSTAMVLGMFQDGTAALPSIRFETDPDTGFYRIAANTLGVSAGGSERARFTSSGMQVTGLISGTAVTQSITDSTTGRLMKVGDFGLGRAAADYPPEYNFGTWGASPSGMYWYNNVGDAGPSNFGTVIALNYPTSKQQRIALSSDDMRMYIGSINSSGEQSTWSEIFGQKNILGTVSQSGGVPTGAVIERGSNANGGYVRFADGTQICNTEVLTSTSAETSRTWPAAFSATPRVLCGCSGGTVGFARSNVVTATAVEVSAYNTSGARIAGYVTIAAFGHWF